MVLFCAGCAGRSQVNGLAGKFCLALSAGGFPLGTHLLPLLRHPLAVAAYVHHHAHFCQQQNQACAAGGEEGQADAGVGQGVGDHGDIAEHLPRDLCHDADAHHGAVQVLGLIGDE